MVMPALPAPTLVLRKDALRRLREGHRWIFANELAVAPGANGVPAGAAVNVVGPTGQTLGTGLFNPATLIAVRLYSPESDTRLDASFFAQRLSQALQLRQALGRARHGRQVHGEGDGLPGLVLDRYGEVVVGQIGVLGLEQRRADVEVAIRSVYAPGALIWKNDASGRALEGLPESTDTAWGACTALEVQEGPAHFLLPINSAQKTGWFYDQRDNRDRVYGLLGAALADREVLDLCSYQGGWALRALHAGAATVTCVDTSANALAGCEAHAAANGFAGRLQTQRGDAGEVARALAGAGRRYALVVADPPAFIKRKRDVDAGRIGYARLFEAAMRCVAPGGFLVACSCSHHYPDEALRQALGEAALRQRRSLRLLAELGQSADHPIHPAMPETRYLKGLLCQLAD